MKSQERGCTNIFLASETARLAESSPPRRRHSPLSADLQLQLQLHPISLTRNYFNYPKGIQLSQELSKMPSIYPSPPTLQSNFSQSQPNHPHPRQPFTAWSAIDDVKHKTEQAAHSVKQGYENMSNKAQAKTGKIEMYSPKYYAACTFGGLLACVSIHT